MCTTPILHSDFWRKLRGLKRLAEVSIAGTEFGDNDLATLAQTPGLRGVELFSGGGATPVVIRKHYEKAGRNGHRAPQRRKALESKHTILARPCARDEHGPIDKGSDVAQTATA